MIDKIPDYVKKGEEDLWFLGKFLSINHFLNYWSHEELVADLQNTIDLYKKWINEGGNYASKRN